jgi:hypothetical protein
MCKLFSINQNDSKLCINCECESNVVIPRTPGEMSTNSVLNVGKIMGKQKTKKDKKAEKVRGVEFEKGKIPSFETVKFADLHHRIFKA